MNSKSLKRCNFRNSNWTQSCEVRCHPHPPLLNRQLVPSILFSLQSPVQCSKSYYSMPSGLSHYWTMSAPPIIKISCTLNLESRNREWTLGEDRTRYWFLPFQKGLVNSLNHLIGRSTKSTLFPVSAKFAIAKQHLENWKLKASKEQARHVKQDTSALWQAPGVDGFVSTLFTIQVLMLAVCQVKSG